MVDGWSMADLRERGVKLAEGPAVETCCVGF
jgi:hypothetical protein